MQSALLTALLLALLPVTIQAGRDLLAELARRRSAATERRELGLDRLVRRQVVVHQREGGPSIRGVVVEADPHALVLDRAQHLVEPDRSVPLAGRVWVPRGRVDYLQELGASSGDSP